MGLDGVVLSNHGEFRSQLPISWSISNSYSLSFFLGGRQLDFARSGIEILPEAVRDLREAGFGQPANRKTRAKFINTNGAPFEIFVDGGFRRGTDVLKAVAMGATGCGIGRPFLYAMSSYGVPGVVRAIQLLKDEMEMGMRLLGVTKLDELRENMCIVKNLETHVGPIAEDWMSNVVYDRLVPSKWRGGPKL